jgi:hypothetical protein
MAEFLEQDAIDAYVRKQAMIAASKTAKEKVQQIYEDVLPNMPFAYSLDSLDNIGECIDDIDRMISSDYKYYEDFIRLKTSYRHKVSY